MNMLVKQDYFSFPLIKLYLNFKGPVLRWPVPRPVWSTGKGQGIHRPHDQDVTYL